MFEYGPSKSDESYASLALGIGLRRACPLANQVDGRERGGGRGGGRGQGGGGGYWNGAPLVHGARSRARTAVEQRA